MPTLCKTVMIALLVMLAGASAATLRADELSPEAQIKALMAGMFDRPDSKLAVEPVVVVADQAIAGWSQGEVGGRALLRRKGHVWQLILCSGDQLTSADNLVAMGLPVDVAKQLATKLKEAESKLPAARLAQFAKFDGIVMMGPDGNHPPEHSSAGHGHH